MAGIFSRNGWLGQSPTAIGQHLKAHAIESAPDRQRNGSWSLFLKTKSGRFNKFTPRDETGAGKTVPKYGRFALDSKNLVAERVDDSDGLLGSGLLILAPHANTIVNPSAVMSAPGSAPVT